MFGKAWEPKDAAEANNLKFAFKNYYDVRGIPNVPPEFALIAAVAGYALPRLKDETTKGKIEQFRDWLRSRIKK
jgi:hypothetical protein